MNKQFTRQPGTRMLALGNEAMARGAIEGGVQVVTAYPGTPSTEIAETLIELQKAFHFYAEWSVNEKVAFEVGAGAALVGARALTVMKGAGLNWAMDTFMTLPLTGVRGAYVVVVADDPGAHYSSNEQDSRIAVQWAGLPCLEPESQQDALEITKAAFMLSEEVELPVVVRSVTRLSHASGIIQFGEIEESKLKVGFNKNWKYPFRWNVYGPPGVVDKHLWQLEHLKKARQWIDKTSFNPMKLNKSKLGIVATGLAAGYARESLHELGLTDNVNFWKVMSVFPMPTEQAARFLEACEQILVIEEGSAMFEMQLRAYAQENGYKTSILGKDPAGPFRQAGELFIDTVIENVQRFAGISAQESQPRKEMKSEVSQLVIPRSSALCAGCPHIGSYWAIEQALPHGAKVVPIINGDIGCYEQAGYGVRGQMPAITDQDSHRFKPTSLYNILDTLYVMGSGVALAQGEQCAGYKDGPIVAVAGDSTFFHATIPAIINALWNHTKLTFIVMDNHWTAMTGQQPSPVTTQPGQAESGEIDIEQVVHGLGVPFVRVADPYSVDDTIQAVREAIAFNGVSVVIARRECALQVSRRDREPGRVMVDTEKCTSCKLCIVLGCPAVIMEGKKASIDTLLCVNCGICVQICPVDAIFEE
jgi:indolepyruvate ferredoxin oxidoreductase alpha subunit